MMGDGFGMGFSGGFMWLIWLLPVFALAWVLKSVFAGQENLAHQAKTSMEILEKRYARGEID